MDNLLEQVERARGKLLRDAYVSHLPWWLFGTLLAAAAAISAPKLVALTGLPELWATGWLLGAAVVALFGAGVTSYLSRANQLEAAAEIDRRFDLRERVASSLSLPESEHTSEIGQALINDAARSVQQIDVGQEFPLRVGRRAWLPVLPAVVAFVLIAVVADRQAAEAKPQNQPPAAEQVKKSAEELRKKIAKKIKEAEQKEALKDATNLLKQVEKGVEEVTKKPDADRKKAVVKLNDIAKQLEDRRKQLGGSKALQNELNKLKNFGKGPAEKAAQAMKEGDWQKALDEIDKLRKQMTDGNLSKDQKQKLAEQLGKMKEQLQKAVDSQKQKEEELKKQIAEQQRKGNSAEAGKLQQKLEQMQQNQQQMQKLQELANQMAQAQQAMQQGDEQAAADAMNQMAEQMQQMQQEIEEMEMLADAMDQIEQAKQAMGCQQCQGGGCEGCEGMGMGQGMGKGEGEGKGQGMGQGQGSGPRPDEKNPTSMRDTRVRQKPGAGSSTFSGFVKGPNIKGDVRQSLKQELTADDIAPAEALDDAHMPRSRREHAQEYFEKLRQEL